LIEEVDLKIECRKHDSATVPFDPAEEELYRSLVSKEWVKPDVLIHFETPEFYEPLEDCYNIGFTMWETSRIPCTNMDGQVRTNWVTQMNKMDEIWTAARDAKIAFESSGVTSDVTVFNGPVDTDFYRPGLEELPIRGLTVDGTGEPIPREQRPFVIGFMGQWTKRKNIEDWLLWLMSQFKKDSVVGLLKTYGSHMDQEQVNQVHQRIALARQQIRSDVEGAGINLITNKLSDTQVARWFQTPDMYISFSRGEGFALPVVQAMASECVVAHTAWGGPRDYITHEKSGFLLPASLEPVTGMSYNPWYRADQWWARVDLAAATSIVAGAMKMREEDPDSWKAIQTAGREAVVAKCSVAATATQLAKRLAELYDENLVRNTAAAAEQPE
jgi:glycosyltransferase involved in cell wall biosynthesis